MAEVCAAAMWAEDHASKAMGMHLERVTPHSARLTVLVTERMVNGHGTCHGGFIFALADSAFAFACNTTNQRHVAAHCDITYLRPARMGDHLVADAHRRAEDQLVQLHGGVGLARQVETQRVELQLRQHAFAKARRVRLRRQSPSLPRVALEHHLCKDGAQSSLHLGRDCEAGEGRCHRETQGAKSAGLNL
jgi:phenylacetic acid degradation protein PaaD